MLPEHEAEPVLWHVFPSRPWSRVFLPVASSPSVPFPFAFSSPCVPFLAATGGREGGREGEVT